MASFINNIDTLICMKAYILLKYMHILLKVTGMRIIEAAFCIISPVPRNTFLIVKKRWGIGWEDYQHCSISKILFFPYEEWYSFPIFKTY